MTVQEALNTAVEGGYHIYGSDGMDTLYEGANSEYSVWTRKDNESSFIVLTEKTFLDPQFWQALGRALGWHEACDLAITCGQGHDACRQGHGSYWMYQWHCFIQAIADGKPPDAFFAPLPAAPTRSSEHHHQHTIAKEPLHPSLLLLLVKDTCQHAQHICEQAASAHQRARTMVQRMRRVRHRRRDA